MIDLEKIGQLAAGGHTDEALDMLTAAIAEQPADDRLLFMRGKIYWRLGMRSAATSDFAKAVEANPDSPAARALEQARDVADFFNPDLYNP